MLASNTWQTVTLPIDQVKAPKRQLRKFGKRQIEKSIHLINEFGFLPVVLVDETNTPFTALFMVEAARQMGLKEIQVVRCNDLDPKSVRFLCLALSRLPEEESWIKEALSAELKELSIEFPDLDLTLSGFEVGEIDFYIDFNAPPTEDITPAVAETAFTQSGDLWLLDNHRLFCGDALDEASYQAVMGSAPADLVFTDSPFNVAIDGHVGNSGKIQHREFPMASGEMDKAQFTAFLTSVHMHMAAHVKPGAIMFSCMDWRHLSEILAAGQSAQLELKNLCVWVKDNGGMGSLYRSRHELVLVFKKPGEAHVNNVQLGKHGRYRTNVWEYAGVNSFAGNQDDLTLHPTVKPVTMVMDAIKDCSRRGDIVLDPFGGSGTTLIAAEKTGRLARLIELDPLYCDVIIRRWQTLTGQNAVHATSGKTFGQIEQEGREHEQG
jgi:DNA modification methylase